MTVRRLDGDLEDGVAARGVLVHVGAAGRAQPVAGPQRTPHLRRRLAHHRRHLRDVEPVQLLPCQQYTCSLTEPTYGTYRRSDRDNAILGYGKDIFSLRNIALSRSVGATDCTMCRLSDGLDVHEPTTKTQATLITKRNLIRGVNEV